MDGLNKDNLLSDLLEDDQAVYPFPQDECDDGAASESLEQRFTEDESTFLARLPLHRELVPPFVHLPGRPDGMSLMPTETNVDELLAELDDESELDELDRQLEAKYEADLWQESKG